MNTFNIWMMGPTRCGKTTLLASIINDFMRISEVASDKSNSILKLNAIRETYARINSRIDDLRSGISKGEFEPECLQSSDGHEVFKLGISYQKKAIPIFEPSILINFHDFPGGWLSDLDKRETISFQSAEVLIMPIDATLVFEAKTDDEEKAALRQLELSSLEDAAAAWANQRKAQGKGGLFMLVPVKCETYFNDHAQLGSQKNEGRALQDKILSDKFFKGIRDTIRHIYPDITAWYLPVDTIGCCYISQKWWLPSSIHGKYLKLRYTVDYGYKWKPYGPAHIMFHILDFIIKRHDTDKSFMACLFEKIGWRTSLARNLDYMKEVCQSDAVPYRRGCKLW